MQMSSAGVVASLLPPAHYFDRVQVDDKNIAGGENGDQRL
jgi:hypothetical protein